MSVADRSTTDPHPAAVHEVYDRMLASCGAEHGYVRARPDGPRVHVIAAGAGTPMVHLHGTNTSALSHLMLVPHVRGVCSYLVDRPGQGLSDPDPVPRERFRSHAVDFVASVLDVLRLEGAVLVGASGGGTWATWFALEQPGRVRGLVMLGSVPTLPGGMPPLPLRLAVSPLLGDLLVRGVHPNRRMLVSMMAAMGEGHSIGRHPDLLDSLVAGARDPTAARSNLDELRALMTVRGVRPEMRTTQEELRSLQVPTLMIWGDRDPVVPLEAARRAAAAVPQAQLEVVSAGHVPQLGHAARVGELLGSFARTC